ncbi:mitochondrial fission ELM1 family protein [Labrys monachus]|uniref:Mitochondrial fission protein ELM1 n=1 Tax=Labrys monachus TaxID=217067 RepID=A0ABU0FCG7_9HYPH|nr:mitochondrial fission ELM1 family protein [Labrys monachus]MDQ0391829.1 mitochondrial fission protein ELM1 [Labrys monachus]
MAVIWTLTDGKAGDALQCLGVAEAVLAGTGGRIVEHRVRPRRLYALAMPWGPPDPADLQALSEDLAAAAPDIAIASGRRAVTYLRWLKKRSPATFTVFLKDPRTGTGAADFIWVPQHDRLRGDNVLATLTSPHRQTPAALAAARAAARPGLLALPQPRVAVLAGGPSKDVGFGDRDIARFALALRMLADGGAGLMVTPSRRTPEAMTQAMAQALAGRSAWIWDGKASNPYAEMLGLADAFVVTADSANMLSEAASTGKTIHVFMPEGVPAKIRRFVDGLAAHGAVVKFEGRLEISPYEPLDSTPLIAREILHRLRLPARH